MNQTNENEIKRIQA